MRRSREAGRPVILALPILLAGGVALWAQNSSSPAGRASTPPPSVPPSNGQQAPQLGVWHHFGETPAAPPTEPRQSSGWRHFGEGGNLPPGSHPSPTWRDWGQAHAREMEQQMLDLLNRDRTDPANTPETGGRAFTLQWNERLAEVARAHSLDMLNNGYFAHEDLQGRSVAGRVEAAGMAWQEVGENIAIYNSVSRAEAAFMDEPRFTKNHRGNILNAGFTEVGIGIVPAADGRLYITQDFYTAAPSTGNR